MTTPRWVSDPHDIAVALQRGKWIVTPWEHLGTDNDLPRWQSALRELCEHTGIDPVFIDIRRRSLTVVVNAALPVPDDEEIHASIAFVQYHRFTGHPTRQPHEEFFVFELIASQFLEEYLVLRPGSESGIRLPVRAGQPFVHSWPSGRHDQDPRTAGAGQPAILPAVRLFPGLASTDWLMRTSARASSGSSRAADPPAGCRAA